MIEDFDKKKPKVMDFCSEYQETQKNMKVMVDRLVETFLKTQKLKDQRVLMFSDAESESDQDSIVSSYEEEEVQVQVKRVTDKFHAMK